MFNSVATGTGDVCGKATVTCRVTPASRREGSVLCSMGFSPSAPHGCPAAPSFPRPAPVLYTFSSLSLCSRPPGPPSAPTDQSRLGFRSAAQSPPSECVLHRHVAGIRLGPPLFPGLLTVGLGTRERSEVKLNETCPPPLEEESGKTISCIFLPASLTCGSLPVVLQVRPTRCIRGLRWLGG